MQPEPERCGVCIVRVVRQASGLRITLTMRSDVEDASTETQHKTTDVAQAVEAVRNFILGLNHRNGDLAGDGGVTAFRQTRRVAGFGSIAAVGKSLEMVLNAGFSAVPPIDNENSRAQLIQTEDLDPAEQTLIRPTVAIQPESGLHCGRARLPADVGRSSAGARGGGGGPPRCYGGAVAGGSQGPSVNSRVRASRASMPHLPAVDR